MPGPFFRRIFSTIVCLWAAALVFAPTPASAKELPAPIRKEIETARAACEGPSRVEKKFVSVIDFNRDRRPDYLLNYEHMRCKSGAEFCGSGGCLTQLFVSRKDGGYVKALDKNLLRIRFTTVRGHPSVTLDLHGSECGKVGVAPCPQVLVWDGNALEKRR
jgi:hypothetical protein